MAIYRQPAVSIAVRFADYPGDEPIQARHDQPGRICPPSGIDKRAGQPAALDNNQVIVQYMALYDMAVHDIYGIFTPN